MEEQAGNREPFLEPVYLNEKMVLNCAAYIFKGYSLESDSNDATQSEHSGGGKIGINFLKPLISFEGKAGSQQSSRSEKRSARRYTVGGLHMSLIDELHSRKMIHVNAPDSSGEDRDSISYVEMRAELRPVDFYALIDTLRIAIPVVEKVLTSIVKPLYDRHRNSQSQITDPSEKGRGNRSRNTQNKRVEQQDIDKFQLALGETENYATAIQGLLEHLENDYRRSKQLEMVMWSVDNNPRPYGVVDLDLADYEPEELRAKLSGGTYHVIGKVTRNVRTGQSINLLQKSVLFSAMLLLNRVVAAQGETDALRKYRQKVLGARENLEHFGLLEIPGPALRVTAMSVCI